jgi:hypothetical protein
MPKSETHLDIRPIPEVQLERVLQSALKVSRQVPFRVQATDEFYDLVNAYGCRIDGEEISYPQAVLDKVLARAAVEKQAWTTSTWG